MKAGAAPNLAAIGVENLASLVPAIVSVYNINTGDYVYVNSSLTKILGYQPSDFTTKGLDFVASLMHPDDIAPIMAKNQAALKKANSRIKPQDQEPIVSFEYRIRHANGSWKWLQTDGSVYSRNSKGKVEYVINVSIDITARKNAEEKLRQLASKLEQKVKDRTARLELAIDASKLGIWEWNIHTNELRWSPQQKLLFGLAPKEEITYERFLSLLHPADRITMEGAIQTALETGKNYQIEHRTIWPDGSIHWLLGQGQAQFDGKKPVHIIGTTISIEERKSTEQLKLQTEALTAERRELKALNRAKDEFISLASHQLRTPATGVKQYLGLLLQGYLGKVPSRYREALQKAYESNERQIKIINDLLLVAKVDAGKLRLNKQVFDLSELIRDVVTEQSGELKHREQTVTLDAPKRLIISADQLYLRMVIENLLTNASKYSPQGSPIEISASATKNTALVAIRDYGLGISKPDQGKIYKKFTQVHHAHPATIEGSGLGLYWCKKIIGLHNGKIRLSSRLNHGSTFMITLPLR